MSIKLFGALALSAALCVLSAAAGMKAGVGRVVITPDTQPVWLAGYAARTMPATGMLHHVWAKALALEDRYGTRVVIITADVLGLTRESIDTVSARLEAKHGLSRRQIFFNVSHTHSGPVLWPSLSVGSRFTAEELKQVVEQNRAMIDRIEEAADQAVGDLAPAILSCGRGTAGFAINRRKREVAPVDHDVPVLRVAAPDGSPRAVLFNYACHCTTLTSGNLLINGDYAGFAMLDLEEAFPGATAFFIQGCAGDQNPDPRGTVEHARQYGAELAGAVRAVLSKEMMPVSGTLRTAFTETRLAFQPVALETFREELVGTNTFRQSRAKLMLEAYNRGNPVTSIPYPVQALGLGHDFTILFLSGEIVVDYTLRVKGEYPDAELLVAGYCNEVQCYIPSRRVLLEGGYEADQSMIYYGLPGPFVETVEETVLGAIRQVMETVRKP